MSLTLFGLEFESPLRCVCVCGVLFATSRIYSNKIRTSTKTVGTRFFRSHTKNSYFGFSFGIWKQRQTTKNLLGKKRENRAALSTHFITGIRFIVHVGTTFRWCKLSSIHDNLLLRTKIVKKIALEINTRWQTWLIRFWAWTAFCFFLFYCFKYCHFASTKKTFDLNGILPFTSLRSFLDCLLRQ